MENYQKRYQNLNEQQRLAVDTIYGPVMVIAGPGTGKTEVLSMRIANLLLSEAQVQPQEILCLTYTDEASHSMRRRLLQIVGTAAHKVNINTFHGFCNTVIQSNSEMFSKREMQPIADLEKIELMHELLDELPSGHELRRLSGQVYYDTKRLTTLFDHMKRENLSVADIENAVDAYVQSLPEREEYMYKTNYKGNKKGDPRQALIDAEFDKVTLTKAAAQLFTAFDKKMQQKGRYDFTDMILWVLQAFKENEALLQSYQERYQYILVDEFQDTNGAQSELLRMLADFWDDPNLFVVGDDDQSIYEFQGARIRNIIEFYERHEETIKVIVLPQNYRSSQAILDKSTATINNNLQRLIHQLGHLGLDKNIVASHPRFLDGADTVTPKVVAYPNVLQEEAAVVMELEKIRDSGFPLSSVALIYAQHKQADNIIALMERKGIPYNVKRPVNVLHQPLVEHLLLVFRYLMMERQQAFSGEALLFEMMHAPFYGIAPADVALLALKMQQQKRNDNSWSKWRLLLNNYLVLEEVIPQSAKAFHRLGTSVDSWLQQIATMPLPMLTERIMHDSGMMKHALKAEDNAWHVQVLYTFFSFLKETFERNPQMKLPAFLVMIEKMLTENIPVPLQKIVQNEEGVYCYTAHGAKGNEFEYVFLIGCTKNVWEEKRAGSNNFKMPDTITGTKNDFDKTYKTEIARRLFYVALTRAKKYLTVSFAKADNAGKPLKTSAFIDEISTEEERKDENVGTPEALAAMEWAMTPVPETRIRLENRQHLNRAVQQLNMSYTTLSKYLNCPLAFYYENVLRVPFLKNDALAFGSAVHNTLERAFNEMKMRKGKFPEIEEVKKFFDNYLFRERDTFTQLQWERRTEQGHEVLEAYFKTFSDTLETNVEVEYKVPTYVLDGVPVTGKIDKIVLHADGSTVVDYKTGNPDNAKKDVLQPPNEMNPNGGDYWRQMVFYKILLENQPDRVWNVRNGIFDYVQQSKSGEYKPVEIPFFQQDEEVVRQQIKDVWANILDLKFDAGCGKEDCHWCNFTKKYEMVRTTKENVVEIDDL